MRKILAMALSVVLLVGMLWVPLMAEGEPPPPDPIPGAFSTYEIDENSGNYLINKNVTVTSENSVYLTAGTVTIDSDATVTIGVGGRVELRGVAFVNNGTLTTVHNPAAENPSSGQLVLAEVATFNNNGTVTIGGNVEVRSSAKMTNAVGHTVTVQATGMLELRGGSLSNAGILDVIQSGDNESLREGRVVVSDDAGQNAVLTNTGTIEVMGRAVVNAGAQLTNETGGSVIIGWNAQFSGGATLSNAGAITGGGTIELDNPEGSVTPLTITGLSFYESAVSGAPLVTPHGRFTYQSEKWVTENNPPPPGDDGPPPPESDGQPRDVTVVPSADGQISLVTRDVVTPPAIELIDTSTTITITHLDSLEFLITPNAGKRVMGIEGSSVLGYPENYKADYSWALSYNGDGTYTFPFEQINDTQTIQIIYDTIDAADLTELLHQTYAVLNTDAASDADITTSLANQLGQWGSPILPGDISITADSKDTANIDTRLYGTFRYTLTHQGISMPEKNGYILLSDTHVAFRVTGTKNGVAVDTVRIAGPDELAAFEIEVPAVDAGLLDIFGYGNIMALPMSESLASSMVNGKTPLPFYSAQYHIIGHQNMNLYGFYVIQEDAYCIHVDAKQGLQLQKAMTWSLNRYANLTNDAGTSEVFFGNDEFVIQPPTNGIGGVTSFVVATGAFTGYTVEEVSTNKYLVHFLSDFYDQVSLNTVINGTEQRTLHIHRVGVNIEAYQADSMEEQGSVGHGTQAGTLFFYDTNRYQLYATYYIPDFGTAVPYGLYVTYTWRNGTTTTRIITEPCDSPPSSRQDSYENGVYRYEGNDVHAADYLLYAAPDGSNAPVRVNVTVMKADPTAEGSFGGIFLGSGRGVEWTPGN